MQSFLVSHAIYAIVLFGVLEAMCIPISSELTFLLGGAIASGAVVHPHPSLALVIILGIVAEMVGSYIAYGVGRWGGSPLVRRWGRYVLITESDVARAERFLAGRGAWALPVARMLPFVRAFASIVLTRRPITSSNTLTWSSEKRGAPLMKRSVMLIRIWLRRSVVPEDTAASSSSRRGTECIMPRYAIEFTPTMP